MLMTTRARLEEHQRADGLFQDPKVAQWWPLLHWDPDLDSFYTPLAQLTWAVRAEGFDRIAQQHLAHHKEAIAIELGAGLSTRYYRVGQDYRYWLELDLPEITALRRQLDTETDSHQFLAQSALDLSWMDKIPAGDPKNLLVIAEGLLMYFEVAQVQALIDKLRHQFPGATLAFDTFGNTPTNSKKAKQLAQIGAPLKWLLKNEQEIEGMGLSLVKVLSLIQENAQYRDRIGIYRWFPWMSKLPPLRNASLILETKVLPLT